MEPYNKNNSTNVKRLLCPLREGGKPVHTCGKQYNVPVYRLKKNTAIVLKGYTLNPNI